MKHDKGFTLIGPSSTTSRIRVNKGLTLIDPSRVTGGIKVNKGFTLIELLVVISIIALLSSVVVASLSMARKKARDSNRIQNARQISLALEQYEQSNNTYKIQTAGLDTNPGSGYVAKGSETAGYTNSILSSLKSSGFYNSSTLRDPIYGTDNYYLGLCTSTNAYNIFIKVEQDELKQSSTTIMAACDGYNALSYGFNYIAGTVGGNSGGLADENTYKSGAASNFVASVGVLDTTFNPGKGMNEYVYSIKEQSDGKIIIAGNFTKYNNITVNRIVRLNTDGTIDTSFNTGSGFNNRVNVIRIQSDGKILMGGIFTTFNGVTKNNIIRLNSDGTIDSSFLMGTGVDYEVQDILIQPDNKILVGGHFLKYNGVSRHAIVRLNIDGTMDPSFTLTGLGPSGNVESLGLQSDGKILIGGPYLNYNGTSTGYLARANPDGTLDTSFDTSVGANNTVSSIYVQPSGKIIIAGNFTTYNGSTKNHIARLESNGSLDSSFGSGTGANGAIYSMEALSDEKIMIGGTFGFYNGTSRGSLARINADGTLDTTFNAGTGPNNYLFAINQLSGGEMLVGGNFSTYSGTIKNNLVMLNPDGTMDTSLQTGTGAGSSIYTMKEQQDGKLIIGGQFTTYDGISKNYIARLNSDSSLDSTFNIGTGASSWLYAMESQSDGKIVIGGYFTSYNGTGRNYIARINTDGTLDTSFSPSTGAQNVVYTVAVQSDGKILAGGSFTQFNGTNRGYIARINPSGSLDTSFSYTGGANNSVKYIKIQSDGKILIGGNFTSYNGTSINRLARINTDGTIDSTFNIGAGFNNTINAIAVQSDGKIIVGGDFTTVDGTARSRIARLNADGSLDTSFNPGTGLNNSIWTMVIQPDGKILIAGYFAIYNGTTIRSFARVNTDGTLDTSFNSGTGFVNGTVYTMLLQGDGSIIAGGAFLTYNGMTVNNIAKIK